VRITHISCQDLQHSKAHGAAFTKKPVPEESRIYACAPEDEATGLVPACARVAEVHPDEHVEHQDSGQTPLTQMPAILYTVCHIIPVTGKSSSLTPHLLAPPALAFVFVAWDAPLALIEWLG
jgi:hypothetical protein